MKNNFFERLRRISRNPQKGHLKFIYFYRLNYIDSALLLTKIYTYTVRSIGVARIFDWGGPKPQIARNDVIRNFRKSNFLWGKDIVEWKI